MRLVIPLFKLPLEKWMSMNESVAEFPRSFLPTFLCPIIIIIIIIIIKRGASARLRESDIPPISPKTPSPQYQPIDRKKRKGKIVEDYTLDYTLETTLLQ